MMSDPTDPRDVVGDYLAEPGPATPTTEWECQCARCGSSMDWQDCSECGGEGEMHEGMGTGESEWFRCENCKGRGGWNRCLSTLEWCERHPMPGREDVEVRWAAEFFPIEVPR